MRNSVPGFSHFYLPLKITIGCLVNPQVYFLELLTQKVWGCAQKWVILRRLLGDIYDPVGLGDTEV